MPIFEYTCNGCGKEFETLVRASSTPDCPECHSTDLAKKLSVFATANSAPQPSPHAAPMAAGGCGSCGHPGGPGACAFNN